MATNGFFIRELGGGTVENFATNLAFAVEDDVGPDSYFTTGQKMQDYFDTRYALWDNTTGLLTTIATGSRILIGDATTGAAITATDSILIGQAAGQDLGGGTGCVAIGTDAMAENVTGSDNTVLGYQAGKGVAGNSHSGNTFVGYQAGFDITTGGNNVTVGTKAGTDITTGGNNTLLGFEAGLQQTTSSSNVGIGYRALFRNVTGTNNTCIGREAGRGVSGTSHSNNTFVGYQAGFGINAGERNMVLGAFAGTAITGSDNSFIGYSSGAGTTGSGNVLIGSEAGRAQTAVNNSVGIGYLTLFRNVTGSNNTCIGYESGRGVSGNSHSDNTFVGYQAGYGITTGTGNVCLGQITGDKITSGDYNVFIGAQAGRVFTTGTGNICIGRNVGSTAPTATTSNQLFIDNGDVDEDNVIIYGEMDNHTMKLNADVRITEPGVETADAEGQLDVIQTDTAGAQPVIVLDQDDVSEEFIKFYGSAAAATLTQSIVAEADVTTATRAGFIKVFVNDEGNQITDQAYYMPIFTLA